MADIWLSFEEKLSEANNFGKLRKLVKRLLADEEPVVPWFELINKLRNITHNYDNYLQPPSSSKIPSQKSIGTLPGLPPSQKSTGTLPGLPSTPKQPTGNMFPVTPTQKQQLPVFTLTPQSSVPPPLSDSLSNSRSSDNLSASSSKTPKIQTLRNLPATLSSSTSPLNFTKMYLLGEQILTFRNYKRNNEKVELFPADESPTDQLVRSFLEHLPVFSDEILWKLSLLCEPENSSIT